MTGPVNAVPATADLIVIGAGPAGMAAAVEARAHGLSVTALDEQAAPGGQIYRSVEAVAACRPADAAVLGPDYLHGGPLAAAFRGCGATIVPEAAVWRVDADGTVAFVATGGPGGSRVVRGREIVVATGAMERPVPVPGWTLPGVMGAGAAQVLLKSSGMVPDGRVVLAGRGPLLLLVAAQLVEAGADVAAVLETTTAADWLNAAPYLPAALPGADYLKKGLALRAALRQATVPVLGGVRALAALGEARVSAVRFTRRGREQTLPVDTLLLHDGVVPHVQVTRQLEVAHEWVSTQRCWRPVLDDWGTTTVPTVAVAGDGGGIGGARAAELSGRIVALGAACRLGRIDDAARDRAARPLRAERARHLAIRPLLDHLYPPAPETVAPADAVIVCRCEEVSAGDIRAAAALGATGPNQLKAFTRCGMGPCQGRICGLTVAEIVAATRGVAMEAVGYYRIRPPMKPLTLGELAGMAADRTDR